MSVKGLSVGAEAGPNTFQPIPFEVVPVRTTFAIAVAIVASVGFGMFIYTNQQPKQKQKMLKTLILTKNLARSCPRALFSQAMNVNPPTKLPASTMEKVREQVHPTIKGRRRFYKHVSVRQVDTIGDDGNKLYEVTLDGRSLRSPGRRLMHIPQSLAWGIAGKKNCCCREKMLNEYINI
jgi:hypothetical protein